MGKLQLMPHALSAARPPLVPPLPKPARAPRESPADADELARLRREYSDIQQALFDAAQVQRKLCAPREFRRGPFEVASEVFPVRHISGDFSVTLDLGDSLLLAVGDIAGKGLASGLWLTHMVGLIRMHADPARHPVELMAALNRHIASLQPEPPLAGLFLARLDFERGEVVYSNAGLPPAIVLRRSGNVESLREGGPMLGAVENARFGSGRFVLQPGELLLACSDGIVECRNEQGDEFGVERLLASGRQAASGSASQALYSVLGAVQDFAGSFPREDDFTLLVLRRAENGAGKPSAA